MGGVNVSYTSLIINMNLRKEIVKEKPRIIGDKMEKKLSEEELDKLLEEQFLKEADAIEEALFSDDFDLLGSEEETDEETEKAYQDLVARLKARGEYREDEDKIIPMPRPEEAGSRKLHHAAKVAGLIVVCTLGVFAASMTSEANRHYFINSVRYLTGNDEQVLLDNDEENESEAEKYC